MSKHLKSELPREPACIFHDCSAECWDHSFLSGNSVLCSNMNTEDFILLSWKSRACNRVAKTGSPLLENNMCDDTGDKVLTILFLSAPQF